MSEPPKKLWQVAWEKVRKAHRTTYRWDQWKSSHNCIDWENIYSGDELQKYATKLFDVAILHETRADILEISKGESRNFGNIEGVRLSDVDQSQKFAQSQKFVQSKSTYTGSIHVGANIDDVWNNKFKPWLENSDEVIIVDPHVDVVNSKTNKGALFQLLKYLNRDSTDCCVTIYTSIEKSVDIREKINRIKTELTNETGQLDSGGIKSVKIRMFDSVDFDTYAHDRHIRFGRTIFKIGRGIYVFRQTNNAKIREHTDYTRSTIPGNMDVKERNLDEHAEEICEFCLCLS